MFVFYLGLPHMFNIRLTDTVYYIYTHYDHCTVYLLYPYTVSVKLMLSHSLSLAHSFSAPSPPPSLLSLSASAALPPIPQALCPLLPLLSPGLHLSSDIAALMLGIQSFSSAHSLLGGSSGLGSYSPTPSWGEGPHSEIE